MTATTTLTVEGPGGRPLAFAVEQERAATTALFARNELAQHRTNTAASAIAGAVVSWDHTYESGQGGKVMSIDGAAVATLGPEVMARMVAAMEQEGGNQ